MKICIENLGMYNEGMHLFKWLDLPLSDEELEQALDDIKICHGDVKYYGECGNPYEKYFIADYECDFRIGEYADIYELNEMAQSIENFDEQENEVFTYLMENHYDFDNAVEKINNHNYYYVKADNEYDLAETYINELYCGVENMPKEVLAEYFDFEAFGRDLTYSGYYETDNGYVQVD